MWVMIGYYKESKFRLTNLINGAFAGLACITPGSGFINPYWTMITG